MSLNKTITLQTPLGFIGLGYLGSRIARRLATSGFPMIVYDRNASKASPFSALGVERASSAASLASRVEVVLSCLADDAAVEDVYGKTGRVLGHILPGT